MQLRHGLFARFEAQLPPQPQPPPPPSPLPHSAAARPLFRATSLEGVLWRAQALGLVRDRALRFRTQKRCLRGRDLVEFLVSSGQCRGRAAAVGLGQALLEHGLLAPAGAGGGSDTVARAPRFEDLVGALYEVCAPRKQHDSCGGCAAALPDPLPPFDSATPSSTALLLMQPSPSIGASAAGFIGVDDGEEHVSVSARGGGDELGAHWAEDGGGGGGGGGGGAGQELLAGSGVEWGTLSHAGAPPPAGAAAAPPSPEPSRGGLPPPAPSSTGFSGFLARVSRSFNFGRSRAASLSELEEERGAAGGRAEVRPRGGSSAGSGSGGGSGSDAGVPPAAAAAAAELGATLWYAGWLQKRGHVRKGFKRRWFVLRGAKLTYYRSGPRDEGASAAAAAGAMAVAVTKTQRRGGVAAPPQPPQPPPPAQHAAVLPPGNEEPAGMLDVRAFNVEAAARERSLLALRLVSKTSDLEYVVTAETERDFVSWVKALTLCRVAWEVAQY
jgi:hypothetical protein